jgi:hypothetical protein
VFPLTVLDGTQVAIQGTPKQMQHPVSARANCRTMDGIQEW